MLDADAALLLADAADRLGDGHIDLTSRGNAQLRGLGAGCGGELEAVLVRAALLPAPTHERVRNIVASPLTGLDRRGLPDVAPWVAELDRLLCASAPAARLSGRFLFALDDGRGDVTSLAADVNLAARDADRALLWTADPADAVLVAAADAPGPPSKPPRTSSTPPSKPAHGPGGLPSCPPNTPCTRPGWPPDWPPPGSMPSSWGTPPPRTGRLPSPASSKAPTASPRSACSPRSAA